MSLTTGVGNRLGLLPGFFSRQRDFDVRLTEVMFRGVLKAPCTLLGPRYVEGMETGEDYLVVRLRGIAAPLYWPKALPVFDLYKAVTDCLHEGDWHKYEIAETRVRPGDVVLDCGAAEGVFSLSVIERASRVIAFEPWPGFAGSLRRTFARSAHFLHVPAALGSAAGSAFLEGGSLYGCVSREGGLPIQMTTIDKWSQETGSRVDFIKGDLESYEFEVLQGARATIQKYRPRIAITVYHPGNSWRELMQFIRELCPSYQFRVKGLSYNGRFPRPVMLHAW